MDAVWLVLALLRITWTFQGQTGYIHPDEFFQSSEIMAGNVFKYEVFTAWEFNASHALRNTVVPYLTSGVAFYCLRTLENIAEFMELAIVTTSSLLLAPRLIMLILSFIGDYLIYKLSEKLYGNSRCSLLLYASSYVTIVILTRTLSNTLETFLFHVLLYAVVSSIKAKECDAVSRNKSVGDSKSWYDQIIVVTSVIGMFNRPTFLAFLFMPCLTWLLHSGMKNVPRKLLSVLPSGVITAFCLITCDSLYFRSLEFTGNENVFTVMKEFLSVDLLRNLTITPLNFLIYNRDASNLAVHGLHPHYTHVSVNLPMLVGPLLIALCTSLNLHLIAKCLSKLGFHKIARRVVYKRRPLHPKLASRPDGSWNLDSMLVASIIFPLALLSLFPHQEMRFLVPLLIPIILFCSRYMTNPFIITVWVIFNALGALFFGVLHQGGLIPSLAYLQSTPIQPQTVIFHHTYMPPRHLLTIPAGQQHDLNIAVKDLAGESYRRLNKTIAKHFLGNANVPIVSEACSLMLVTPEYQEVLDGIGMNYTFVLKKSFRPHLSMEKHPDIVELYDRSEGSLSVFLSYLYEAMVLNLYCIYPIGQGTGNL